jgi:type IX secretion system PorP/SprF family membrane protein
LTEKLQNPVKIVVCITLNIHFQKILNKIIFVILLILGLTNFSVSGQDIQFSQFYAAPLYLNPAFAGSAHSYRGILHQRIQWPSLDGKFLTSMISADGYSSKYKSGFGLVALQDYQGANTISSSSIGLQYAYELPLTEVYTVRAGLELNLISRSLDYSNLRFPSQYNDEGFQGGSVDIANPRKTFADIGSGIVFYSNRLWVSAASSHDNTPNQSFVGGVSRLPLKLSFTGGYKIPLGKNKHLSYLEEEKDVSITPTAHYKLQGKSDQLDLGLYGIYDRAIVAVWYRGLPIKKYEAKLPNNESMVFILGYMIGNISLTYSYDFTISKLAQARTGGSHEINLTYIYHKRHKSVKPMRRLPCPHFYKESGNLRPHENSRPHTID